MTMSLIIFPGTRIRGAVVPESYALTVSFVPGPASLVRIAIGVH
jgi:hypothetical protein